MKNDRCSKCGAAFECGMDDQTRPCWCAELPAALPLKNSCGTCLCRACLKTEIAKVLMERAGLCSNCLHAKMLKTKNDFPIYLCSLAQRDSRFPKYPNLPMKNCTGYSAIKE